MISTDVRAALLPLIGSEQNEFFFASVQRLAEAHSAIYRGISSANANNAISTLIAHTQKVAKNAVADLDPFRFYEAASEFKERLRFAKEGFGPSKDLDQIEGAIDSLIGSYKSYLVSQSADLAVELAKVAFQTNTLLRGFVVAATAVVTNIVEPPNLEDDQDDLIFRSHRELSPEDFSQSLRAMIAIYGQIARLLDAEGPPLQIVKIESGSMLAWFKGSKKVILVVVAFIRTTLDYAHRNYTLRGQFQDLDGATVSINSLITLRNSLSEAGIDASSMDEDLRQAAAHAAKYARMLANSLGDVEVGGKILGSLRPISVSYPERKLLNYRNEDQGGQE